jgi:CTP:molybdopterin cytidylyltransferase MocA
MVVGVLLAAGASSRMGQSKPLVKKGSETFAAHAIRTLWRSCGCVVTVLGANAEAVQAGIEEEFARLVERGQLHIDLLRARNESREDLEVRFVTNPRWKDGMLASVQTGLAEALMLKPDAVMVHPVDHPDVAPDTVAMLSRMMLDALSASKPAERKKFSYGVVPRYRGLRGHPVMLSPALAAAVRGDRDASDLSDAIRRHCRLLGYIDVDDPGITRNVNGPAELKKATATKKATITKKATVTRTASRAKRRAS